jgi:hypothetical protein
MSALTEDRGERCPRQEPSLERGHILLLLALLGLVYAPYIVRGGLLRDDLGFVTAPRDFTTYFAFQGHLSSFLTMTARPVSAILHGASYWFFGAHAGAHHATNLALFAGSVILAYCAISRILDRKFAFVTCAFAAVYPASSGTVFSAMMMNSNLAGLFWAGALCFSSSRYPSVMKDVMVALFLVLSGLSYESLVPLFTANILAREPRSGPLSARTLLRRAAPVLVAVALLALYRVVIERWLFDTSFTRATLPPNAIARLDDALLGGLRVAFYDSIRVSLRALRNITLVPPGALLIFVVGIAALSCAVYHAIAHQRRSRAAAVWIAAAAVFLAAHLIFVFSDYRPTSGGFESRTQGGIRFATAVLIAATALLGGATRAKFLRLAIPAAITALFALFAFGMLGQREGWIEAAHYNKGVIEQVGRALRVSVIGRRDSLTLIAELDRRFPHSVNGEPIFGTAWDLGPALELANPDMRIRANVYEPKRARVDSGGVTIHGYWRASFPFYYLRVGQNGLREVASKLDWEEAVSR